MHPSSVFARGFLAALLLLCLRPLGAAPVPHPDRPDRLVETRDGLSVEYSPGQEMWMEMGFAQMRAAAAKPVAPSAPAPARQSGPAVPGSARFLQENRGVILTALARQIGLPKPTALQGRVFDTFLGYYRMASELMQNAGREMSATLTARRLAIWQRDDLVARLRAGAKIEGMIYDPATDRGEFGFKFKVNEGGIGERLREIQAEIDAQKLKHHLEYGAGNYAASVTLGQAPDAPPKPADNTVPEPEDIAAIVSGFVFPVIYRDAASLPTAEDFDYVPRNLAALRMSFAQQAADYRDPILVGLILHETAETGLMENIITSRDRRWLCDGTANYAAWRVTRDLMGPDFAAQVYDLDAQLRLHAALQPKIDLVRWSAVESDKEGEAETALNRARYAFATRVMFLLAERHGENALAQLWSDVARTSRKKVSAKTFTEAYKKRYKANLGELIAAAEKTPIPAATTPAVAATTANK